MKLTKIKLIVLFAIIILALAAMTQKSFGAVTQWLEGQTLQNDGWPNGIYCTAHGVPLSASGSYSNGDGVIYYSPSAEEPADITVAYALYCGYTGSALQNVIWASPNNVGTRIALTDEQIIEYRDVYNEIFSKVPDSESVLVNTEDPNNIKVLVDRIDGTYTVGPYKLDLRIKDGVSETTKKNLLNEIRTGKEGQTGVYAIFSGITGINGEILELVYGDGSKVKSKNGLDYGFPDFDREFYIRFKPKHDGAIISTGKPNFHIQFLKRVKGTVHKYDATAVQYGLNQNYEAYVRERAVGVCKLDPPPPSEGTPNSVHVRQHVPVELEVTVVITCRGDPAQGNITTTYGDTRTEHVFVNVEYRYDENGYLIEAFNKTVEWTSEDHGTWEITKPSGEGNPVIQTLSEPEEGTRVWVPDVQKTPHIPVGEIDVEDGEGYNHEGNPAPDGLELPSAPIDMQIGGHVWIEEGEIKENNWNGKKDDKEKPYAGMQVDLYTSDGTLVTTTTTDKNGRYRFYGKIKYPDEKAVSGLIEYPGGINYTENGTYSLLNPLKQYYVVFEYDGQRYQATYSYSNIASPGGYSNAREVNREEFNAKFKTITSNPDNYTPNSIQPTGSTAEISATKRAYGIDHKIAKDNGEYATTGEKNSEGEEIALTYEDVYNQFLVLSTSEDFGEPKAGDQITTWTTKQNNYYIALQKLKDWLKGKGVNNEFEKIQSFIYDSLIKSSTQKDNAGNVVLYPKYDKFVLRELYDTNSDDYKNNKTIRLGNKDFKYLYTKSYDMARYVDFGVCNRLKADIRLQKDLYKTTLIVNGKKEEYEYNKRDLSADSRYWDIRVRAADSLYDGTVSYTRDVRASEYLLGEENVGAEKTLKAYVTYKIGFKNSGDCNISVKEIVDHYDADGYIFDRSDPIIDENTYIGEYDGTKIQGKTLSTSAKGIKGEGESTINSENYRYNNLYLTGMDELLTPGNVSWLYVTFRVQNNDKGKIKLDYLNDPLETNKNELKVSIGKRNIAEINAYETYYVNNSGITEVPNYLENGNKPINTNVAGKVAGLIDFDSNPGSLTTLDLDGDGNLKVRKTGRPIDGKEGLLVSDRQEDDSSQAPNIRILVDNNDDEIRRLRGYVFEDNRTNKSKDATIGNGEYDNGETKVNGVRVQLVELVSDVDETGVSKHQYNTREKIWESYEYNPKSNELVVSDNSRYSSGDGKTKIIVKGKEGTIFDVLDTENLEKDNGEYVFKSLPAGDFYIRFIYGDDYDNTLVNNTKLSEKIAYLQGKVNELSSATSDEQKAELDQYKTELDRALKNQQVNTIVGAEGRNAKSYNGQDYKSTTYQIGLGQGADYYGIKGYTDYEGQNYTEGEKPNDGTEKDSMYFYDIIEGDKKDNVSDAKDVWAYRNDSTNYSKGADGKVLMNKRAEILASFERPVSYTIVDGEILDDGSAYKYGENGEKIYDYTDSNFKTLQTNMLDEFIKNTQVTAQTGIINTEIERNRDETEYDLNEALRDTRTLKYTVDNINLGLVERPKAQLKLNKEVANYKLILYNGQVLFDAQKSVNNLSFSEHVQHTAYKDALGLFKLGEPRVGRPGSGKNEIIQNYVDNEMLADSSVGIDYDYFVENVGETDYTDKEFYYTGNENNPQANVSKTKAVRVVDYITNSLKFEESSESGWIKSSADILIPSKNGSKEDASIEDENFVNRLYNPEVKTYTTLITSDEFGVDLAPGERKDGKLELLSDANTTDSKIYCNMSEIIATSNDVGRRCVYSIPGNEEMADQTLGNNAASGAKTSMNRILVNEIDADSSQEIRLLPPTGTETGIKMNNTAIEKIKNLMSQGIVSVKLRLTK